MSYTIRIQSMLYAMGDDDKENFRTGSDGAVVSRNQRISCTVQWNKAYLYKYAFSHPQNGCGVLGKDFFF